MENRITLLEQIERLLALASEEQLRILYVAALYLVQGGWRHERSDGVSEPGVRGAADGGTERRNMVLLG